MTSIDVACAGTRADGWTCTVTLHDGGREVSSHCVNVATRDLDRLAPGAEDPARLVEVSFAFLLERESPQSILRTFELNEIGRYFSEYETDIRRRMRDP
jgi:hypothetical protein